jgi:hypothetical protein
LRRRTAIFVSSFLLLALAAIIYLIRQERGIALSDPYAAVSSGACIIIETRDLQSFVNSLTTEKGISGEFGRIKEFNTFNTRLKDIADNLNKEEFRDFFSGGKAVITFYPGNKGKLVPVLSMSLPAESNYRNIRQALLAAGAENLSDTRLQGVHVLSVPLKTNNDTVFISLNSGLLLISSSGSHIRTSLGAISGNDAMRLPEFSRVLVASGQNEDKIFVVFKNLRQVLEPLFSPGRKDIPAELSQIAAAAGSDIFMRDDGIIMSGFSESSDTSFLIHQFKSVPSTEFQTYRILPASTAFFITKVLKANTPVGEIEIVTGQVREILSTIREFIGDEVTSAMVDIRKNPVYQNNIVIYELNNPVLAEKAFTSMPESGREVLWYTPDDQVRIPVYRIPFRSQAGTESPGYSRRIDDTFIAFYNDFMVTGTSYLTIASVLYDNLLNHTLENDIAYHDFESSLASRAGCYFYCVPSRMVSWLEGKLSDAMIKSLRLNSNSLEKIQAAGFQLSASNNLVYSTISVRFREEVNIRTAAEWETLLDTTAAIKPFFFTNHLTGAKEIFVQDYRNNVYLVNATGRVLWKVQLRERIEGNIFIVDYYKNGKLQLLFSGKNYLHLIDRNGNYVDRYPVKLRSPATNSLALFDYDNNKNYRILIAGEDRLIYSYEKSGNVVKGWKPFRTAGTVRAPVNYFHVSGKDYIAVSDDKSLYLLDRYGNKRVNFTGSVGMAAGSVLKLGSNSNQYLVCTSDSGSVQHVYFDGTVRKFSLRQFTPGHSFDIFDIDADGSDEYIFIDKGVIYLYDHNRNELFVRDMGSNDLRGPISFTFSHENRKIGVLDAERKLIYLFDRQGKLSNGSPLTGASMFSIGRISDRNSFNLIVGGPGRFLYNYKIEDEI